MAKEALDEYGADKLIVILGFNSLFTLGSFPPDPDDEFGVETGRTGWTMIKTFLDGDPAGVGALSQDDPPGIKSYVIFEFKDQIPEEVWNQSLGDTEMMLEMGSEGTTKKLIARIKELRGD